MAPRRRRDVIVVFLAALAAHVASGMAAQQEGVGLELDGLSFDEKMARLLARDAVLFATDPRPRELDPEPGAAGAPLPPPPATRSDLPGPPSQPQAPPLIAAPPLAGLQLASLASPPQQEVAGVPPQTGNDQAAAQLPASLGQPAPVPPTALPQLAGLQLGRLPSSPSQASFPSAPYISLAAVPTWDAASAAGGEGGPGGLSFPTATVVNIPGLGPQLVLAAMQQSTAEYASPPDEFLAGALAVASQQNERTLLQNSSNASSTGSSQSGVVGFVTMDGRLDLPVAVVLWGMLELVLILCCVRCCGSRRKGNLYEHGEEELFHL